MSKNMNPQPFSFEGTGGTQATDNIPNTEKQRNAALAYAARGFAVFPCAVKGKRPVTPHGYKDATSDLAQVALMWGSAAYNVGLVPGSCGFVVVDVDGETGQASADELKLPVTAEVTTGRGRHLYYRYDGAEPGNGSTSRGIDLRYTRGYVLAPPSIHPSGTVYRWRRPLKEAIALPVRVLEALTQPTAAYTLPARTTRSTAPANAQQWFRVERYLQRFPVGLRDGRKTATYRLAAVLLHTIGLQKSEALEVVAAWNSDNLPPLPPAELLEHFNGALRNGARGRASA